MMKERIGLVRRNAEIRRLRFDEMMDVKEIADVLRDRWPEINKWVIYKVIVCDRIAYRRSHKAIKPRI